MVSFVIPLPTSLSMSSLTASPFNAYIFGAFNNHIKAIFLTMILSYRLIKPKWCNFLIGVFPILRFLAKVFIYVQSTRKFGITKAKSDSPKRGKQT